MNKKVPFETLTLCKFANIELNHTLLFLIAASIMVKSRLNINNPLKFSDPAKLLVF
jgi:hypothetical protein